MENKVFEEEECEKLRTQCRRRVDGSNETRKTSRWKIRDKIKDMRVGKSGGETFQIQRISADGSGQSACLAASSSVPTYLPHPCSLQLIFHTRRSTLLRVESTPLNCSSSLNVCTCVHALFGQKGFTCFPCTC